MNTYLCFWELHVDDRTFPVYTLVEAESKDSALDQLHGQAGPHYHLQAKGCLGEFDPEEARKFMAPLEIVPPAAAPPVPYPTVAEKVEGSFRIINPC